MKRLSAVASSSYNSWDKKDLEKHDVNEGE